MRRYRCFFEGTPALHDVVELDERESSHLGSVLRVAEGDEAIVVNGTGAEWQATVVGAGRRLRLRMTELRALEAAPHAPRLVCCALTKSSAFEEMLTHATELGMTGFIPLTTKRSIVELDERREERKQEKWRSLCIDALKQSERRWLPTLEKTTRLADALEKVQRGGFVPVILAERSADKLLAESLVGLSGAPAFFFGPEGGWTEQELRLAQEAGAVAAGLGQAILRTETAVLAALAISLGR